MITKLTQEQQDAIIPFREKWKARILRTEQTDEQIIKGVQAIYKEAGYKTPVVYIMDSPLGSQVLANLQKKNRDNIEDNIWANIRANIWDNIRANIWDNIEDNIRDNIEDNIWANIRANIEDNIWDNIMANIRDNIRANISTNFEDNIWDNIRDNMEYFSFSSNDSSWIQWYIYQQYFFDYKLIKEDKYSKKLDKYLKNVIDTWMCLYFDGVAIVSRKPIVKLNDREFLHSDIGPAVEFRDGYKLYYINGVKFEEEMWKKVVTREEDGGMTYAERLAIVDVDQRTQAINPKYASFEGFIKEAKGILLDDYNKYDVNGKAVNYQLYKFPKGGIFQEDAHYAYFDCPSTRKKHFEGVGHSMTVPEAMAWSMSDDISIVTPEEWIKLVPLVDEN